MISSFFASVLDFRVVPSRTNHVREEVTHSFKTSLQLMTYYFVTHSIIFHSVHRIVASASIPSCCCFSPVKATLVFGGMRDGSLVAWDLREPPTMHHSYICGGQDWLLRFPTYNTAGVLKYDNHNSPITAIVPILQENKKPSASGRSMLVVLLSVLAGLVTVTPA